MVSTTLCDYQVLSDRAFTLDAATNMHRQELYFEMPLDFYFGKKARKPVLAFKAAMIEDSSIIVSWNGRDVAKFRFDKSHTRGIWEAIYSPDAFPNNSCIPGKVPLIINVTRGKVEFSDVIMWYQIKREL
jgi:hypothetical protein